MDTSEEHLGGIDDAMAEDFAEHAEDSAYNAFYDRPAVLALLGDVAGLRVLDAGCGPGLYLAELIERGATVSGFDASAPMVDLASRRTAGRAEVVRARLGDRLPYSDAAFDAVVCALVIHYVEDRHAALAELHRVLVPGGVLLLSTQHPVSDWSDRGGSYFDVRVQSDTWLLRHGGARQVSYWREPLTSLCAAVADAGFLIERLVEPLPAPGMAELYPDDDARLRQRPDFLVLRLLKR